MITALALTVVVLGVLRFVLLVAAHLINRDINIVEHAVSDLALGPTRALSRVTTWLTAVLWLGLGALVWFAQPEWSERGIVLAALSALAVIFAVLPFLPTDLEGDQPTVRGRLHLVAAVAWFALAYGTMPSLVRMLRQVAPEGIATAAEMTSRVAGLALTALVVALVIPPLRRRAFGLSERLFLLAVIVFYVLVPIGMLTAESR